VPLWQHDLVEAFGTHGWTWFNEPVRWKVDDGLTVTTDPATDFWQTTHYGFQRDNGHIFARELSGDFTLRATFAGEYTDQYDQAGLALRIDAENWLKTGIELVDGRPQLSVVVTRKFSDWSVVPAPDTAEITIELRRTGDTVTVESGGTMLRLAYFPPVVPVLGGVMCASPDGQGYRVRFTDVSLE
jgi:regulation of enolase protein 1 (concanavalin A-like superfamily)